MLEGGERAAMLNIHPRDSSGEILKMEKLLPAPRLRAVYISVELDKKWRGGGESKSMTERPLKKIPLNF